VKKLLAIALAVSGVAGVAWAQQCAPFPVVSGRLAESYGERMVSRAFLAGGVDVLARYQNDETGTWTLVAMTPQGLACAVASGTDWQPVATEKKPAKDAAS
jgi:hypothetical protein